MTSTPSSYNSVEKHEPVLADNGESILVHGAEPVSPTYNTPAPMNLRKYRGLRITLAVLGGVSGLLALASFILDIVICAIADNDNGSDDMEGANLTVILTQLFYGLSAAGAGYCLVVMLVCFILNFTSARRLMSPGCGCSACLAVTVMIGVACGIVETAFAFVFPVWDRPALGVLPLVRTLIMIAYFVIVVVCACTFDSSVDRDIE